MNFEDYLHYYFNLAPNEFLGKTTSNNELESAWKRTKKDYRSLLRQHHPDKFVGVDEQEIAKSNELSAKLNAAYALVEEAHKLLSIK